MHSSQSPFKPVVGDAALGEVIPQPMRGELPLAPRARKKAALVLPLFDTHKPSAVNLGWMKCHGLKPP
jgi:hypothetical protein